MKDDPLGNSLIHHFAQANPLGDGQDDVPALLRRVADTIERIEGAEVLDIVLHNEVTEDGDWFDLTVYYSLPNEPQP